MAFLFDAGIFSVEGLSGEILPGTKLYWYASGTSTPLATYSNEALTTPNANPVLSDSEGRFPSIWLQNANYKLVMELPNGTQRTRDPIRNPGDGVFVTTAALAGPNGTALVGTIQAATGAVPAAANNKIGEILSVLDFGDRAFMGQGQDATAVFAAAISYMNTLSYPATLLLPARARFLVNGSLPAFTSNAKYILGEGAQINHDGGTLFTWGAGTPSSVIDGGIMGLNYQGLATPTAGTCMVAQEGMSRLRLNGIRGSNVSAFLKAGLVAYAGGYFIENCCLTTHNVNNDVIRHGDGANSDIKGLNLTASGVSRVLDQTTLSGALANAITFGAGGWDTAVWNGLLINGYKNGLLADRTVQNKNISNFRVSDFYFDYCADGITLRNTQTGGGINNMQFANGWVVGMDGYGVHLDGTVGSHRNITFRDVHALLGGKNNWRLASQTMDNVRILNAIGDFANRLNATNTSTERDDFVALFGGWVARGGRFGRTANGFAAAGVPNWQARYGATLPTTAADYVFEDNQIEGLTGDIQSVISNTTLTAGKLFSSSIKNNRVPGGATRPAYATTETVTAPTSAAVQTSNTPFTYDLTIYGGTVTSIQHNGTEVGTDRANMTIRPGDTWVVVYSVAPTIKRIIWP